MENHNSIPSFQGNILLCEDNEINQHYIKGQLTRLGLQVDIAANGQIGLDMVARRQSEGQPPYDLIFMDIHMPVMGGLEAADLIKKLQIPTPLVALTANVSPEDCALYAQHGMAHSLSKPFAAEELWQCLWEYLQPLDPQQQQQASRQAEEESQRKKLYSSFARRNQTTYEDICGALQAGDVQLAHRLAHTLRGLAGLMGKKALQESARLVEQALAGGQAAALQQAQLEDLGQELATVLAELAPYLEESPPPTATSWDKAELKLMLERLQTLVEGDNAESKQFAEALRTLPGAQQLIIQLEDYEFAEALIALADLRKTLEI